MLNRIRLSLAYRAKWAKFGVFYLKQPKLDAVRIAGRNVHLSLPDNERSTHEYEFGKIVFDDCYRLSEVSDAATVLDIGANIGLFTLAARNRFPKAAIHAYEPNPALQFHLAEHCGAVGAERFPVAIGAKAGTVHIESSPDGSLHSITQPGGTVLQVSFAEAVAALGSVHLLKLDCEGAEWDIFTDPAPWGNVRSLVMEYHLWAKQGSSVSTLESILQGLGFRNIQTDPNPRGPWGMAYAER